MQAFKDDRDNYYAPDRTYVALRVPQVEGNAKLLRRIRAGEVDQKRARELEHGCLSALRKYDRGGCGVDEVVDLLRRYEQLYDDRKDRSASYRETLAAQPWKSCPCDICRQVGIEVIIFRGSERNKRRGFHNLATFYGRLNRQIEATRAVVACDVTSTRLALCGEHAI
jgi:hypothetical protein